MFLNAFESKNLDHNFATIHLVSDYANTTKVHLMFHQFVLEKLLRSTEAFSNWFWFRELVTKIFIFLLLAAAPLKKYQKIEASASCRQRAWHSIFLCGVVSNTSALTLTYFVKFRFAFFSSLSWFFLNFNNNFQSTALVHAFLFL